MTAKLPDSVAQLLPEAKALPGRTLPDGTQLVRVVGPHPVPGLKQAFERLGHQELAGLLPAQLDPAKVAGAKLVLVGLELPETDPIDPKAGLFVALRAEGLDWSPMGDFHLRDPMIAFRAMPGGSEVRVGGLAVLGDVPLQLEVALPRWQLSGRLAGGAEPTVGSVLAYVGLAGVGLDEMRLSELALEADAASGAMSFALAVRDVWQPLGHDGAFAVERLAIEVHKDSSGAWGSLEGTARLGREELTVRAERPGADRGWILSGLLQPQGGHAGLGELAGALGEAFGAGDALAGAGPLANVMVPAVSVEVDFDAGSFDFAMTDAAGPLPGGFAVEDLDLAFSRAPGASHAALHGAIRLPFGGNGKGTRLEVDGAYDGGPGGGVWSVKGILTPATPFSLEDLITGMAKDLGLDLPVLGFKTPGIKQIALEYDTGGHLGLDVELAKSCKWGDDDLVHVSFERLRVSAGQGHFAAALDAEATFAGLPFAVQLELPQARGTLALDPQGSHSLANLLGGLGFGHGLGDAELAVAMFTFDAPAKTMVGLLEVDNLGLGPVDLKQVRLSFAKGWGEPYLHAELKTALHLDVGPGIDLDAAAVYDSAGGWKLSASGRFHGLEIPIHDFFEALAEDAGGLPLPPLPSPALDALEISYESLPKRFELKLKWQQARWELIPGLIEFDLPDVDLIAARGIVTARLTTHIVVLGLDFLMDLQLPAGRGKLELVGDGHIHPVLEHLHLPDPGFGQSAELKEALLLFDASVGNTVFHLELDKLDLGPVHVQRIGCQIEHTSGHAAHTSARIYGDVEIDPVSLHVEIDHQSPESGWQLRGRARFKQGQLRIGHVISELAGQSLKPPADLEIDALALAWNSRTKDFTAGCEGKLDFAGKALPFHVGLSIKHPPTTVKPVPKDNTEYRLDGWLKLAVGDQVLQFSLEFDQSGKGSWFAAGYSNPGGGKIKLGTVMKALGSNGAAAKIADGLEFGMQAAALVICQPKPAGGSRPKKGRGSSAYVLAADVDAGLELSRLPLVSKVAPPSMALRLVFRPTYASRPIFGDEWQGIERLLPPELPPVPVSPTPESGDPTTHAALGKGLNLVTTLRIGDQPLQLGAQGGFNKLDAHGVGARPRPRQLPPPKPPDNVKWVPVNKKLGPVSLRRVGLGLDKEEKAITVLLDAGILMGPLDFQMMGLGARYGIDSHELEFELRGLALALDKGTVKLTAAFLRFGPGDFVGEAVLTLKQLTLGAIGGYTDMGEDKSVFVYAFLNYPIGGPPFFFVEGLAAGFGFNRRLTAPPIHQIHSFPLVAEVMGTVPAPPTGPQTRPRDIMAQLTLLRRYIAPEAGQYWVALGVKFNVFRLIHGFLLAIVTFGKRLKVYLLGNAHLQVPPESPKVLAFIELDVRVEADPLHGWVKAGAELTDRSWILSKQAHVFGDFAFAAWALGPHQGDFVYSVGGYHPDFACPDHYPKPARRVGMSWTITSQIGVRGGFYYALTPHALMAGGSLDATWKSGSIEAGFRFSADFLIQYKPFHYDARASISIHAHIGCLGGSMGADLHLWGPPFAGSASVKICGHKIHIHFGGGKAKPKPIAWDGDEGFRRSFLPHESKDVLGADVTGGIVRSLPLPGDPDRKRWVVNPKELSLTTHGKLPVLAIEYSKKENVGSLGSAATELEIPPMEREIESSVLKVELTRHEGRDVDVGSDFRLEPVVQGMPTALWKPTDGTPGDRVAPIAGGVRVVPRDPVAPGVTAVIPRVALDYEITPYRAPRPAPVTCEAWTDGAGRGGGDGGAADAGTLRKALFDAEAGAARKATLAALGFDRDLALGEHLPETFILQPRIVADLRSRKP